MFGLKLILILSLIEPIFPENVMLYNQFYGKENGEEKNKLCENNPCIQLCKIPQDPKKGQDNLKIKIYNGTQELLTQKYFLFYGKKFCADGFKSDVQEKYYIQSNGNINIENFNHKSVTWSHEKYCVQSMDNDETIILYCTHTNQNLTPTKTATSILNIAGMHIYRKMIGNSLKMN